MNNKISIKIKQETLIHIKSMMINILVALRTLESQGIYNETDISEIKFYLDQIAYILF